MLYKYFYLRHKDNHTIINSGLQENQQKVLKYIHAHKTDTLKPNCNTLKQFATHYCPEDWFYEETLGLIVFIDTEFEFV